MEELTLNKKYFTWIDNNIKNLNSDDTVLILGATGSMASYVALYLAYLHCNLILAARNIKEANNLKEQLRDYDVKIDVVYIDYACRQSIDEMVTFIKKK